MSNDQSKIPEQKIEQEQRKMSDVLLSLEEKVLILIKTISANDMNNKLILDRLNKLINTNITPTQIATPPRAEDARIQSAVPLVEISQLPVIARKPIVPKTVIEDFEKKAVPTSSNKIPVGQRITDHTGKDLFMADVIITNMGTGESFKSKTSAVGKWQAYLSVGKYSVNISKIIDAETMNKIESLQEIEVTPKMKSLQLPIAIIKR